MRRMILLILVLLLVPICAVAESAADAVPFFYAYGAWESFQAEDAFTLNPVTVSAQGNETLYQLDGISVGATADRGIFLVRAELDASDAQSVQTMVSLCAALSGDMDLSSARALELIGFLGEASGKDTSDPAQLGEYEIYVQSDGATIYFSALLQGYDQAAPAAVNAPASSPTAAAGSAPADGSGQEGTATSSAAGSATQTVRVATGKGTLRMRADSNEKAKILTEIRNGTELTLLEWGEEWCHVQYKNQTGYVMTKYLSTNP